jgi:hypothetical protein
VLQNEKILTKRWHNCKSPRRMNELIIKFNVERVSNRNHKTKVTFGSHLRYYNATCKLAHICAFVRIDLQPFTQIPFERPHCWSNNRKSRTPFKCSQGAHFLHDDTRVHIAPKGFPVYETPTQSNRDRICPSLEHIAHSIVCNGPENEQKKITTPEISV